MITYRLGVDDLARVRLAYSAMTETALSLWALVLGPQGRFHLTDWHEQARNAEAHYDAELVRALVSPSGARIPDFITPLPTDKRLGLEEECELIATSDPTVVAHDLMTVFEGRPPPAALAGVFDDPQGAAQVVADALYDYHRAAIAPYWSAINRVLESDIIFRGREFAQRGTTGLFDGLGSSIRLLDNGLLEVHLTTSSVGDGSPDDRGLVLTPSVFTKNVTAIWNQASPGHSWLSYPARGQGTMIGEYTPLDRGPALAALVGSAKAELLLALAEPASTSQLAHRFSVTPSAVSQNLRVLRDNGLIEGSRHGRSVLYRLTPLGTQMASLHRGDR
ncbi:ArsR/SmtB family transcription factor [Rhodococcoides fascians]|uniref:ArsR/SmtB family transcription factor n=1 Tax=Rhodococcoides fascians TaxID=1828 RepID=UPI0006893C09|nr:helix-turn-helix domain-containing protein [Rhodococcus fascians]